MNSLQCPGLSQPVLHLWADAAAAAGSQRGTCMPVYLPYSSLEDSTSFAQGMWGASIVLAGALTCVSVYIQTYIQKKSIL